VLKLPSSIVRPFFLAVKPLSRLFRRLFLERLQVAFEAKGLGFFGDLARLADPAAFAALLAAMRRVDWIVYLKKPFGGPARALAYLGRYTHRVYVQAFDDFGVTVVMFHSGANDTFDAASVLKKYGD
jgi:Putative transposase